MTLFGHVVRCHLILGRHDIAVIFKGDCFNSTSTLQVRERPQRAARVLLDIEAGAPVLLIPESSRSKRLIVANLGQLRVRNRFLPAGTRGTFSLRDKVEKLTMAHTFFPSLVSPTITIYTLHHHSAHVGCI